MENFFQPTPSSLFGNTTLREFYMGNQEHARDNVRRGIRVGFFTKTALDEYPSPKGIVNRVIGRLGSSVLDEPILIEPRAMRKPGWEAYPVTFLATGQRFWLDTCLDKLHNRG